MAVEPTSPTTRLLTLLNVSAARSTKRKRHEDNPLPTTKLNKRRSLEPASDPGNSNEETTGATNVDDEGDKVEEDKTIEAEDLKDDDPTDPYEYHFGPKPASLTESSRKAVDEGEWASSTSSLRRLGTVVECTPSGSSAPQQSSKGQQSILERLRTPFQERQAKLTPEIRELQSTTLSVLSSNRDVYHTHTTLDTAAKMRDAITLHYLNHVTKKRRRVLKNNERLSHTIKASASPPEDVQDQGFTRPSILLLVPFRSSAFNWFDALSAHTPSPTHQVENRARFLNEFGLPEGAVDKLATAEPGTYPRDHVETFKGNMDDNFRVGIKLTRKSVKLFADFYACDVIIASPLGLRMSIEKDNKADFLSSIEMLIVDQMDTLTMQNWEHVQFVFSHLNKLPKESHNTDFSRIKPWYLDGHAAYLRQTVLLSAYETPETRNLFNQTLKNVAGKVRTTRQWAPVQVPQDLDQNFVQFDCTSLKDEPEKRFHYFTTQMLPAIMKSAVQSANTAIFVPSSFDFIRVENQFRKQGYSYTVLSEYSSNQDISRARQAFFTGKKSFLLISERFHFYRRYKLRGIRNLVFYGPPDHAQFYTELLSYPFLDEDVQPGDVTCRTLFSKYDWFRLERIAGTKGATALLKQNTL